MLPRLRAIVIAIVVSSTLPAIAQQAQALPPASGTPDTQSSQVPGGNQPKPAQNQDTPARKLPVLKPAQPAQNEEGGGNRAKSQNSVGAVEHEPSATDDRLANLTFWLVIATIGLMAATVLLWLETRKMAKQAVEASKDTKESIKIAKDAALETARAAQAAVDAVGAERAWMCPSGFNFGTSDNYYEAGAHYNFAVVFCCKWKNASRSPAINTAINFIVKFEPFDKKITPFDVRMEKGTAIVGPGSGVTSVYRGI